MLISLTGLSSFIRVTLLKSVRQNTSRRIQHSLNDQQGQQESFRQKPDSLRKVFSTPMEALEAGLELGRQQVDSGFQPTHMVV